MTQRRNDQAPEPSSHSDAGYEPIVGEFIEAWLDAHSAPAADQQLPGPSSLRSPADLEALFQRANRCAEVLHGVWSSGRTQDPGVVPNVGGSAPLSLARLAPLTDPQQFGRFQLRRILGRGGMGTVFLAFDPLVDRPVALKIPHPGALLDSQVRERFLREARVTGSLKHPGIVPVFESGQEGDVCYLVSEYCEGPTLGQWLSQQPALPPVRIAAAIGLRLAEAMHHAHERGVLHRDLKPANVLLDGLPEDLDLDSIPSGSGSHCGPLLPFMPRITDFGLAVIIEDDEALTRTGEALGTAAYMAPEQAEGNRDLLSARTDVFALGVILYEMLCGKPPFARDTAVATLAAVREAEPESLRVRRPEVPRDLDAICRRCLEKNPERRYASAAELQSDLERFLRGEPTFARPVSATERLLRWARRSPSTAAPVAIIMLAVAGLLVGLSLHSRRLAVALRDAHNARTREQSQRWLAQQAARRAAASETQARQLLYAADMGQAVGAWNRSDLPRLRELLQRQVPREGQPDLRGFEWHFLNRSLQVPPQAELAHGEPIHACAVTPDGKRLITGGGSGKLFVWDLPSRRLLKTLRGHPFEVRTLAISPDGTRMVSGGYDRMVLLWDLKKLQPLKLLGMHETGIGFAEWSPDGARLATAGRYSDIRVWSPDGGLQFSIPDTDRHNSLAFSPDGRLLYVPSDEPIQVWDLETQQIVRHLLPNRHSCTTAMCLLAGGQLLASSGRIEPEIAIVDPHTNALVAIREGDCLSSRGFVASPAGRSLASCGADGVLRLFDVSDIQLPVPAANTVLRDQRGPDMAVFAHEGAINACAFASETILVTCGEDGMARLWDLRQLPRWQRRGPDVVNSRLALVGTGEGVRFAADDPSGFAEIIRESADSAGSGWGGCDAAHSADERWIARILGNRQVEIWNCQDKRLQGRLPAEAADAESLDFASDGGLLAVAAQDGYVVHLCDPQSCRIVQTIQPGHDCSCVRFSPGGQLLGMTNTDGGFTVWDVVQQRAVCAITKEPWATTALAWNFDGSQLVMACDDLVIRLWDANNWTLTGSLSGMTGNCNCLVYSPDGKTLFSGGDDGRIRMWHVPTGQMMGLLYESRHPNERILDLIPSVNGHFVAAATRYSGQSGLLVSHGFCWKP